MGASVSDIDSDMSPKRYIYILNSMKLITATE